MPQSINQLGALLLLAQPSHQLVAQQMQLPLAGLNLLPKFGVPAVQQGSRLQPRLPTPLPFTPSQTRGEAATALRSDSDLGAALVGAL
jgi:hypothetical protein